MFYRIETYTKTLPSVVAQITLFYSRLYKIPHS